MEYFVDQIVQQIRAQRDHASHGTRRHRQPPKELEREQLPYKTVEGRKDSNTPGDEDGVGNELEVEDFDGGEDAKAERADGEEGVEEEEVGDVAKDEVGDESEGGKEDGEDVVEEIGLLMAVGNPEGLVQYRTHEEVEVEGLNADPRYQGYHRMGENQLPIRTLVIHIITITISIIVIDIVLLIVLILLVVVVLLILVLILFIVLFALFDIPVDTTVS